MREDVLKERVAEITGAVDGVVKTLEEIEQKGEFAHAVDFRNEIKNLSADLQKRKSRFDAKKYFVVCLGAVKAGKSTLLNALAEKMVSPDGAGVETTKRCSIILSSDKDHPEGITLYRTVKKEESCKYVQDLLDYFQEIIPWDSLSNEFEKSSQGHSLDNLADILTQENPGCVQNFHDFCLAEIRVDVPDESILNKGVAFIDMPGIDGQIAGVDKNPILGEIPNYCQHLLWVQSSVSALNATVYDNLQKFIRSKAESIPIYCILNVMKTKSEWYSKEAVKAEADALRKRLWENLPQGGNRKTEPFAVNAAMAYDWCVHDVVKNKLKNDYCDDNRDRLLNESNITFLKDALVEKVHSQKEYILKADALKQLNDLCTQLQRGAKEKHSFEAYFERVENERNADRKKRRDFEICKELFGNQFATFSRQHKNNIREAVFCKFATYIEALNDAINNVGLGEVVPGNKDEKFDREQQEYYLRKWIASRDELIRKNLREEFKKLFQDIADDVKVNFQSFKDGLKASFADKVEEAELFKNVIDETIIDIEQIVESLNSAIFCSIHDQDSDIKSLDSMEAYYKDKTFGDIPIDRGWWGPDLGQKLKFHNYDRTVKEIQNYAEYELLDKYKKHLREKIKESIQDILQVSSEKSFASKTQEIKNNIEQYLDDQTKDLTEKIRLNEKIVTEIDRIEMVIKRQIKDLCDLLTNDLR